MEKILLSEIVKACSGSYGYPADKYVTSVVTDSKKVEEGSVFIAIKGERFDAHDFVGEAVSSGAVCAVTERAVDGAKCIIVDSTRAAYLSIAHHYRNKFDIPLVAVTGSVGKTTTKDFIWRVLSESFNTHKTPENRNNDIGLPETLLNLNKEHQAAVIEMGMNHQGEISKLSTVAAPTICVITNIGTSHIENLGSRENILKAKLEILDGADKNAPVIMCKDDEYLKKADLRGRRTVWYSVEDTSADVYAKDITIHDDSVSFTICEQGGEIKAKMNVLGLYNVKNALAAYCVGRELKMKPEDIVSGIAKFKTDGIRQTIEKLGEMTIIKDCYNASPDSMGSALELLDSVKTDGRRIAVFADMKELGKMSKELHTKVGGFVSKSKTDILLCFGDDSRYIVSGAVKAGFKEENAKFFTDKNELCDYLNDIKRDGDTILFKASRAMKLEEVIEKL